MCEDERRVLSLTLNSHAAEGSSDEQHDILRFINLIKHIYSIVFLVGKSVSERMYLFSLSERVLQLNACQICPSLRTQANAPRRNNPSPALGHQSRLQAASRRGVFVSLCLSSRVHSAGWGSLATGVGAESERERERMRERQRANGRE